MPALRPRPYLFREDPREVAAALSNHQMQPGRKDVHRTVPVLVVTRVYQELVGTRQVDVLLVQIC